MHLQMRRIEIVHPKKQIDEGYCDKKCGVIGTSLLNTELFRIFKKTYAQ